MMRDQCPLNGTEIPDYFRRGDWCFCPAHTNGRTLAAPKKGNWYPPHRAARLPDEDLVLSWPIHRQQRWATDMLAWRFEE